MRHSRLTNISTPPPFSGFFDLGGWDFLDPEKEMLEAAGEGAEIVEEGSGSSYERVADLRRSGSLASIVCFCAGCLLTRLPAASSSSYPRASFPRQTEYVPSEDPDEMSSDDYSLEAYSSSSISEGGDDELSEEGLDWDRLAKHATEEERRKEDKKKRKSRTRDTRSPKRRKR